MSSNFSTHLFLACSSILFDADNKVLFVASTCPLLWEHRGMEYKFLILSSEQKVLKATLSNCGPLSAMMAWGIPN